jgi:hypothetical protein
MIAPLVASLFVPAAVSASAAWGSSSSTAGRKAWVARDAGPQHAFDAIGAMAVSPDGTKVYVARSSDGVFVVVARDAATGQPLWEARTSPGGGAQAFAHAAVISTDGSRLFVTGEVETDVETRESLTVAYDTGDGTKLWASRISAGQGNMVIPRRLAVSSDGARVYMTGSRTGRHGIDDFWNYVTAAYEADTGSRAWMRTFDGRAHGGDTAEGLGVSPDGSHVFVTGTSRDVGNNDRDVVTIAYEAGDGSRTWIRRYDLGADDWASDLMVSPKGARVFVAGFGRASLSVPHVYAFVGYDATDGAKAGDATYGNGLDDMTSSATISGDGSRVFLAGAGQFDYLTVAFDTTNYTVAWARTYDGGHGVDVAYGLATSPNGAHVYVTGESEQGRNACFGEVRSTAFATVEYDAASGLMGWVARYAGEQRFPDQARFVEPSPVGSLVYVAGDSDSVCRSSDVATVAYEA